MGKNYEIDNTDLRILSILMENASTPYTEVAKKVFVSSGTVHVRMRKMEDMGIVKKTRLEIDYSKIGYDITAFIGIYLRESYLYDEVVEQIQAIPEILSINYTTGNYSIFIKIICQDTNHLMQLLNEKIQKIKGIERTETFISLQQTVDRPLNLRAVNISGHE